MGGVQRGRFFGIFVLDNRDAKVLDRQRCCERRQPRQEKAAPASAGAADKTNNLPAV